MQQSQSDTQTVLVTGGSGFLAGWCIVELLNAGYRVRTTVRDLAREPQVRAALAPQVDPGDRLDFHVADLLGDDGWAGAVAGCHYVLHVASPFPPEQPKDADELIEPARDGTLRVLKAALDANVKRIVVTSSIAAIGFSGRPPDRPLDERDWADTAKISPYAQSKTLAERAAWELVEQSGDRTRLAVVNPGAIIGPVLSDDLSYSIQLVQRMLRGEPAVPKLGFSLVDVRDVAKLEVAAMTAPDAGGERFVAVRRFTWMAEVAATLRERLGPQAKKVPRITAPNFLIKAMALFDGSLRSVTGDLGRKTEYSAEKAQSMLGWSPRPVEDSIEDCARSLIDQRCV